jgi:hypothetical protein
MSNRLLLILPLLLSWAIAVLIMSVTTRAWGDEGNRAPRDLTEVTAPAFRSCSARAPR